MSRRKQAKPRSLKRELDSVVFDDESTQDTLTFTDTKLSSPTEQLEVSSIVCIKFYIEFNGCDNLVLEAVEMNLHIETSKHDFTKYCHWDQLFLLELDLRLQMVNC
ncbi:hypothetical protein NPIL_686291 [Nephila pilipes]|uniref:Uncharacterized protein n=1 Tax=Nephila pilipes TaxID=299642 RepID=A0A8X6TS10_NEPPI|nr:hypothetical protein NPIL_686291 [Nephila pilipes]